MTSRDHIEALYQMDLRQIENDRVIALQEARRLRDLRLEELAAEKAAEKDEPDEP